MNINYVVGDATDPVGHGPKIIVHVCNDIGGCDCLRSSDPRAVARMFAELLTAGGKFAGCFRDVVFAVFDRSQGETTYRAFSDQFKGPTA